MNSDIQIIFLNGCSSSGKTSLARALQLVLPEPWFHIALDQFRDSMPDRYRGLNSPAGTPGSLGINVMPKQINGKTLTMVQFGPIGKAMLLGMHRAIVEFAASGNKIIIDDLLLNSWILQDYIKVLENYQVMLVGLRCPLDVVNKRELNRIGRFPGTAEEHFETVHAHNTYDIEVDTNLQKPLQCSIQIHDFIKKNKKPNAFNRLRSKLSS